jgi:hypothetical protein
MDTPPIAPRVTPSSRLARAFVPALLLALGLVAAGYAVSHGLERFRMADRSITVKGLAERSVESDYATWTLAFRRAGNGFGEVQQALNGDRDRVVAFLKGAGFKDDEIQVRPLEIQDLLSREYAQANQPFRYNGVGRVLVKSARVAAVADAALATDPLVAAGVSIEPGNGPWYELRGFNEAKASLITEATRNAREQGTKFAAEAGAQLGRLRSANQGVITLSGEDPGGDDRSSRTKRLRVVSTFEYELR